MSKSRFSDITIEGARTNNLKDINLKLPINKISCIYGPSGSGKSSLAFGTLVDESKRRFINSLPNDIKFLWNIPPSADVDKIEPILPVWALSQINPVVGSRPVVSDLLGITELLVRHLTLEGDFVCGKCKSGLKKSNLLDFSLNWLRDFEESDVVHIFIEKDIYTALSPEGTPVRSTSGPRNKILEFNGDHGYWEVVRTRKKNIKKGIKRLYDFLGDSKPEVILKVSGTKKFITYKTMGIQCDNCGESFSSSEFSPDRFNPLVASGACSNCDGFGQVLGYDLSKIIRNETLTLDEGAIPLLTYKQFNHLMADFKKDLKSVKINPNTSWAKMSNKKFKILEKGGKNFCGLGDIYNYLESKKYKRSVRILSRRLKSESECLICEGTRLNQEGLSLKYNGHELNDFFKMSIVELLNNFKLVNSKDLGFKKLIYALETASDLGLDNIRLNRKVKGLSSGEYQRLLLVKILSQEGTGMLFVLDEPSRGLTLEEQNILMKKLGSLRAQGNTVALVDHSPFIQNASDFLIEMGPGAGAQGGMVIGVCNNKPHFSKENKKPEVKIQQPKSYIEFTGVSILEKEYKKIKIPLYKINWVKGNSGVGKSLFFKYFFHNHLNRLQTGENLYDIPYHYSRFHTTNVIEKVNYFDPELRTASSRSTVGTFIGFSELIRKHFANLPISVKLGLEPGTFSPNSELGKCLTCEGRGVLEIDMQFLENLTIKCEDCDGKKLKNEVSSISDGKMTVDDAYNLPLVDVFERVDLTPKYSKLLEYTKLLKLSHLALSRSLKSLSGGERLRLQFLKNLNLRSTGEIFVFDNLSIGLSGNELDGICSILVELQRKKNTVIIIDSNPYFAKISENLLDFNRLARVSGA